MRGVAGFKLDCIINENHLHWWINFGCLRSMLKKHCSSKCAFGTDIGASAENEPPYTAAFGEVML
jgi:hypothetical protein